MIPFSNSCLITAFLSVLLGAFVMSRGIRSNLYRLWALFCLSVATWSAGLGLLVRSSSAHEAMFWLQYVHYVGAILIPILFFHFVLQLIQVRRSVWLILGYATAALLEGLSLAGLLANVAPLPPFNFYTVPRPSYGLFVLYFFAYVVYAHVLLFRAYRGNNSRLTIQVKFIGIGTAVGFLGGSTAFLPVFHLPIFPYGVYGVLAYIFTVTYAILHHQLLDIRLALRDTTVNLVTGALLGAGTLAVCFPIATFSAIVSTVLGVCLMGLLMMFAYEPIRKSIQPAIDRFIFANRFAYLEELSQLPNDLLEFSNLREMLKFLVTRLKEAANLEHVAVMMYDPAHQSFIATLRNPDFQTDDESKGWNLSQDSAIIHTLKTRRGLLFAKDKDILTLPRSSEVVDGMSELGAAACFAVMKQDEVVGLVVLGPKVSKEQFNQRDMEVLRALQLRLENFLLQALVVTQESLNMVKDSHDMKNDINTLRGRIAMKGFKVKTMERTLTSRFASIAEKVSADSFSKEELLQELSDAQNVIHSLSQEQQALLPVEEDALDRLRNKLQNWSEYGRLVNDGFQGTRQIEVIDVARVIHMCVERWAPAADRKQLTLRMEMGADLYIKGEKSLLEQIMDNLVDNAIKSTDRGGVVLFCRLDGNVIRIDVQDSGCGIPANDLEKIFKKPFYQGKGRESLEKSTGVGLVLVGQYAKNLQGTVSVESEMGKGTTFHIVLPAVSPPIKAA